MSTKAAKNSGTNRRHVMAAVVLGTAMSTLGAGASQAAEADAKAVRDIGKYCVACWRNARLPADCWNDCTQDVFSRLVQTIPQRRWSRIFDGDSAERREFFRAIDAVKKRTQRRLGKTRMISEPVADRRELDDQRLREDRELVQETAKRLLSSRQQQILRMTMEGWSVQQMADSLAINPERVSDEKYKAVQKLRRHLSDIS